MRVGRAGKQGFLHQIGQNALARGHDRHRKRRLGQAIARQKGAGLESGRGKGVDERSEEHTSELQSLMRISYAVFCLKKKNNTHKSTLNTDHIVSSHILASKSRQT